jgi:predicted amidohydrolase YtcJ
MSNTIYDSLYRGGTVITVNRNEDVADWVAVKDGKIAALGRADDEPKAKELIELDGAVLLPGLYDAHCHVMPTGFFLDSVNLSEAKSIDDVLRLIKERCARAGADEWVFAAGFMAHNMKEGRFPNRFELDSVSGDRPVMLAAQTLHGAALNTKGLKCVTLPDVAGVGRGADGSPDGTLLSDDACFSATAQVMALLPEAKLKAFIASCVDCARKKGVTSIVGLLGQFVDGDLDVEIVERDRAEFPVNIVTFYQTWDFEKIKKYKLPRIGGCLTLDGAGFEYTMALQDVYPDRPERRGFLIHTDEEIYNLISRAHREGIQTAFHALGDRAIDQLLFIFRQVIGEQGNKDLRHRVEHFSLPWDIHMDMLAEMKLIASMQPAFSGLWGEPRTGYYDKFLDKGRGARMEIFPEIIKRGGVICGGSDSPVTFIDPLYGIACCIDNPDPRRNVSVHDALKIFTQNAAYSVHQEGQKGSVEVGKDADFTVIDRNPYDCAGKDELYGMKTLMTVKDAKVTFRA